MPPLSIIYYSPSVLHFTLLPHYKLAENINLIPLSIILVY
jgi:hypothetical protein